MESTKKQVARRKKAVASYDPSEVGIGQTLAFSVIGGLSGAVIALLLILIFSAVALSLADPDLLIGVAGAAIPCLCSFLSGVISGKAARRAPLLCGAISALTVVSILSALSFISGHSGERVLWIRAALCAICIFLSVIGAVAASNVKRDRRKRKAAHK